LKGRSDVWSVMIFKHIQQEEEEEEEEEEVGFR